MVEVQMGVDDESDGLRAHADFVQSGRQRSPLWSVMGIDVGVYSHPAVYQQRTEGVIDEIAQARLNSGRACSGLLGGTDEVPEIDTVKPRICHGSSVPWFMTLAALDHEMDPDAGHCRCAV
jgi:hypothetical protein